MSTGMAIPALMAKLRSLEDQQVRQCAMTTELLASQRRRLALIRQAIMAASVGDEARAIGYAAIADSEGRK